MRYTKLVSGIFLGMWMFLAPTVSAQKADSLLRSGYRLVWSDEFDRNGGPDPANWTYEQAR